jgi:hypothetical protein
MKKITLSIFTLMFSLCMFAQSTINVTTSGGSFSGEKWVSITTEPDGAGTQVYGQGDGTQCNGSGLINEDIMLAPGTYYVNCYDQYDDGWDGTLISVTAYGVVIGNNGGVSPSDGEDTDASNGCEGTTEELEVSFEIIVPSPPACEPPTALSQSVTSAATAELSWTSSAMLFDVELVDVTAGGSATGTPTVSGITSPYTAMGLTDGNDYEFYVRADCGADGLSTWSIASAWTQNVPPANDDCENAIALTVNSNLNCGTVTSGTTVFASASSQADDVSGTPNNDVWFSFVATAPTHRVSLANVTAVIGTSTDMGIGVYDATGGCDALVLEGTSDPNTLDLSDLTAGTTYLVRVYGWSSSVTFTAQTTFDVCIGTPCQADAGTLTADEASVVLSGPTTISATEDAAPAVPADYDVTYVLTSGPTLIIEQAAATPSFVVNALGDYTIHTLVAETTDAADPNYLDLSVIEFGTTTGGDILDLIDAGDLCAALDVTGAPISVNDGSALDFNNVQWVAPLNDQANGNNVSLTVEANTPVIIYAQGFEPGLTDAPGQAAGIECWIAINNENTDPATWDAAVWEVATYLGESGNNDEYTYETSMTPIGANYVASRWSLNDAGFTYAGYNGTWDGTTNVNIELIVDPISNDNFEDAEAIACGVVYNGSTTFATLDRDDAPDGVSADSDTQNVWYSYTGTVTGEEITLSTCSGSDYDTECLIYTYDSVSDTFTFVAEGYDECGFAGGFTFETTFTSDGTSTYYISLAGYNGAAGNYEMSVACVLPCTADAGTLTADATPVVLAGGTATISATANGDSVVPTDYDVTYVLTSGSTLIIEDAGATPSFEVTTAGDYTIHTLVAETTDAADPNYLDLSVIVFGTTTGGDVLDIINDNNLCAALDVAGAPIVVDEALNIDDLDKAAFTYFPNPVKNTLTLNAQNTIENVTMYNMLGQVVLKVTPNAISSDLDMSNLQTGTYFVQVMIANVTKTIRVIKQ